MVAIWHISVNHHFKLYINRGNGGLGVLALQHVPELLSSNHVGVFVGNVALHVTMPLFQWSMALVPTLSIEKGKEHLVWMANQKPFACKLAHILGAHER